MDDLKKKAYSLSDDELEDVSGGKWVPKGHDPFDELIHCPICAQNGVDHYFWARGYGVNEAYCRKTNKRFNMLGNIITLNNGTDYEQYAGLVSD